MDMQAEGVVGMLRAEEVRKCAVIAHSMGAVVAVNLCEKCKLLGIEVVVLISCEGNLDVADDAFHARKLYASIIHKELWARDAQQARAAVLYWSIVWMMRECASNTLLPRIKALPPPLHRDADVARAPDALADGGRREGVRMDVLFVYGSKRRADTGKTLASSMPHIVMHSLVPPERSKIKSSSCH
jgi:pimeloyl-ACP methyl ester carboxylesterase